MRDPYEVLGVTRNTSMDDIKKSYRTLSRKYHPDSNINNPNREQAEEMFKEVQQAYEAIIDEKEHGKTVYSQSAGAYRSTTDQSGYYGPKSGPKTATGNQDSRIVAATSFCNNGYYAEAVAVLDTVPYSEKTAHWYFLYAFAKRNLGDIVEARDNIKIAIHMDPNNMQYRKMYEDMEFGNNWYQESANTYGAYRNNYADCCIKCLIFEIAIDACCLGGRNLC